MSAAADPLASLKAWDLEVELGGREYVIPAAAASVWLPILLDGVFDSSAILPGMLAESEQEELEEALLSGRLSAQEVYDTTLEVVAAVSGRDWWWTFGMLNVAAGSWHTVWGDLVGRGIDPARLPLGAVLDAMYMVVASRLKDEVRRQLDRDLNTPPAGVAREIDEKREAAAFLAMMNQGV